MAGGIMMGRTLFAVLCLTGCTWTSSAQGVADSALSHFPRLDGWQATEEQIVYNRENLWELIDGAADLFVSYGFEDLRVVEYRAKDSCDVRVELYRHNSRNMAFGMYAAERSPEFDFISLGTQGYIEDGLLNFVAGKYYVKISSHVTGKVGRDAMLLVGGALETRLAQGRGWPAMLALFPPKGRIPNSEGLIPNSFLGYSFFPPAYTCRYDSSRGTQAFLMECDAPEEAGRILSKYARVAGKNTEEGFEGMQLLKDPHIGRVIFIRRGRFLGGVLPASGASVPRSLAIQLEKVLRESAKNGQ
jgi:hypothetical protein